MNDDAQIDFFGDQELSKTIPVLYIPIDGPPRIEQRNIVGSGINNLTGQACLTPETRKKEIISYRDDGTIIVTAIN